MSDVLFPALRFIAVIGGFVLLIVIHEFGHLVAAKISKIKVTDFFVGFGPKLWTFKKGETTYGIAAIPLGGYVKMAGSDLVEDEEAENDDERGLAKASLLKKFFIISAGSAMNFIAAFLIIAVVFGYGGTATNVIDKTLSGYPAKGILKPGDKVIGVNSVKSSKWVRLSDEIKKYPNKNIKLVIQRDSQTLNLNIKAAAKTVDNKKIGFIGVQPKSRPLTISESLKGSGAFLYEVVTTINGLVYKAITGQPAQLAKSSTSIVGAVVVGTEISTNILNYLFFIGSISLALGYVNMLPIPPLDAGRILLYVVESIKGSPIKRNTLIGISATGFALLLTLMLYLVIKDIINFF